MPRRGLPALFLFASAPGDLVVCTPVVDGLVRGTALRLDMYSTSVTTALDLAVITPAAVLRRFHPSVRRAGYPLAISLLVLEVMLAPLLAKLRPSSQLLAGVSFPAGQIVGPIAGFATVALIGIWVLVAILRNIAEPGPAKRKRSRWSWSRRRSEGSVA